MKTCILPLAIHGDNEAKHKIWEGGKQNNPMNNTKMVMCPNVNLKMLIITSLICTGYVIVTL